MAMHEDGKEYDIILAGGGTAACVIAGRLALADPSLSILIIEGGKSNLDNPFVTNPAMYLTHIVPESQTALFYKANANQHLAGRETIVLTGGILGGGSSINFMMYTRAQGCDFDSWRTEGWDFKSLLPFLKKFETYHPDNPSIDKSVHGHDGPINVTRNYPVGRKAEDDMLAAAASRGEPEIVDLQDFKSCGGFTRSARYVGTDGKRQDAAHRFIHPLMASGNYPNLHLLLSTKVVRVLFDSSNRANGVECEPTASSQPVINLSKPRHSIIKARKLVIVSSGALGTPSILERSGVGNKELLERLNIPIISDLPGVGENYQDHHLMVYPYKTNLEPKETLDELWSGRLDFTQAVEEKNPILGWNGVDAAAKVRPSDAEVSALGAEFQTLWDRDFASKPERPLMLMATIGAFLGDSSILPPSETQQYICVGNYTAYPYSRGSIHIVSPSANVPASFNTGFFSHPADVTKQIWAYKKQREIYRRTNAYQGELALGHPQFAADSKAALSDGPIKQGGFKDMEERKAIPEIEYSEEDDKVIEQWIRENVTTTWHSLGTCKMAPREEGGVVDPALNVYGTRALKVADLSIPPENVAANTNNTALMIGEKAADIIIHELGLGRSKEEQGQREGFPTRVGGEGLIQASL